MAPFSSDVRLFLRRPQLTGLLVFMVYPYPQPCPGARTDVFSKTVVEPAHLLVPY